MQGHPATHATRLPVLPHYSRALFARFEFYFVSQLTATSITSINVVGEGKKLTAQRGSVLRCEARYAHACFLAL